jgi:hypothetical protein
MRYLFLVLTLLMIASGSSAQSLGNVMQSNGGLVRSEAEFNLMINEQQRKVHQVLDEVQWEPKRLPTSEMTKEQQKQEVEWSKWMLDLRKKLKAYALELSAIQKKKASYEQKVSELREANADLFALQEMMEKKSQLYNMLSNITKAQQDATMDAIRSLKGS